MNWDISLRLWFLVALSSLATAFWLSGRVSALPALWRSVNIAAIGIVGVASAIGLGAETGVLASVVLLLVVLAESLGLWLKISRGRIGAGGAILVVGGTLCVLFAATRILGGALRVVTSSESVVLTEVLAEGVLRPLLLVVGAVALGIGSRLSSGRIGAYVVASSVLYFVAVGFLALAANEAIVGESSLKALALACLAFALAGPTLLLLWDDRKN